MARPVTNWFSGEPQAQNAERIRRTEQRKPHTVYVSVCLEVDRLVTQRQFQDVLSNVLRTELPTY